MLVIAILYLPITLIILSAKSRFSQLTSWSTFKRAWFERFWTFFGSVSKPLVAAEVEPLLYRARGVVLDVGPASGIWMDSFSPTRNKNISKLLLLEPNTNFHHALKAKAKKFGLDGKYEVIAGRIEDLEASGIKFGTIDTITTVHVLCSVKNPELLIKELYQYLKPGGQWLVYEHIKIKEKRKFAALWQGVF
jgi:2-polyprenyl-3-methyl-5-hydroxy-6-metoxy-1,4-benzoquinol methylase